MPEGITAESLLNNIKETLADSVSKKKSVSFSEEEISKSVSTQFNKLFGRQKPVHNLLGGGKSADVLLWRNKKISAGVLGAATVVWVLFEWLNYHFLSLVCFALGLGLLAQFLWSNGSGLLNRSQSKPPRLVLPDELFVNTAKSIGAEVLASLLAAAVIGSWCNFLTVLYIGFVAFHTLPVLYERYEDQVDGFAYSVLDQLQHQYRKVDASVLSKIPKGKLDKGKKHE